MGSTVAAPKLWERGQQLWHTGFVSPWLVRPSQTRDWTRVSCTGSWILYHWASREACAVLCLVAQSCQALCNPMDWSPPGSSVHGDSPGQNTGVGGHALLRGIFSTQGLNTGLLYCTWILYHLSHQGNPWILEWVAYPFSRGIFLTQELNWGLLHCKWILYQGSQGSPREAYGWLIFKGLWGTLWCFN